MTTKWNVWMFWLQCDVRKKYYTLEICIKFKMQFLTSLKFNFNTHNI